jgi:hypothetical protein
MKGEMGWLDRMRQTGALVDAFGRGRAPDFPTIGDADTPFYTYPTSLNKILYPNDPGQQSNGCHVPGR